jgi:hypothetical protein
VEISECVSQPIERERGNMHSMSLAPHTTIVNVLQRTGEISISLLAYKVGREEWEIRPYLETLRKEGIISIEGEKISITSMYSKTKHKHWFKQLMAFVWVMP